jgi:hypothetical protein
MEKLTTQAGDLLLHAQAADGGARSWLSHLRCVTLELARDPDNIFGNKQEV